MLWRSARWSRRQTEGIPIFLDEANQIGQYTYHADGLIRWRSDPQPMAPSTSSGAELPRNGKEPMSPTRRPWVPSVMVFAVLAIGALAPRMALTATTPWVHTDMDDYPPGATVYISG